MAFIYIYGSHENEIDKGDSFRRARRRQLKSGVYYVFKMR